jgi:hypothetical protein
MQMYSSLLEARRLATLLSGTTFYLLKNPDIYSKLVEEIRSTFEREEDITLANVGNLKVSHCCLQ